MGDFTIQLSSNLVNKLAEDSKKVKSKTKSKRTKSKIKQESQKAQGKVVQKTNSDDSSAFKTGAAQGWPLQQPLFLPVMPPGQSVNPEIEAIKSVLQESEKVLKRLQRQEENMLQEVTQRAKDLRDKEFKLPYQKPMPCMSESNACLSCYKEHAKDPLKCAYLVRNFADCTRRFRQQLSAAKK